MGKQSSDKSIDFDQVADLYDSYVQVDFDIEFWKQEARAAGDRVLELMCGTGRIGVPLIEAGISYTGLDYCRNQIRQFQRKLAALNQNAHLIFGDARDFHLRESFNLVFIGFSSLSEVVNRADKLKVLQRIGAHLDRTGRFTFSLHNPAVRDLSLDQQHVFDMDGGARTLTFYARFQRPSVAGVVNGTQRYLITDREGRVLEDRHLDLTFHLIARDELEDLLAKTGFRVERLWGDYDRSAFTDTSPLMIYQCSIER